jgi:hypothetical protein
MFLWCFYYLGSQACKEEYRLVNSKPFHKARLALAEPTVQSILSEPGFDTMEAKNLNEALVGASVFSQVTANTITQRPLPYDAFGNPLVPFIETLNTKSNALDRLLNRTGWLQVPPGWDADFSSYSGPSLYQNYSWTEFGPIDNGNLTYDNSHQYLGKLNFVSQYMFINCSLPERRLLAAFPNGTLAYSETSVNFTNNDRGLDAAGRPTLPQQFELWGRWNSTTIDYQSGLTVPTNGSIVSVCNITKSIVDVESTCVVKGCTAKKMRYNKANPSPSPVTPFDDVAFAEKFFNYLLQSTGPPVELTPGDYSASTDISAMIDLGSVMESFRAGSDGTDDGYIIQGSAIKLSRLVNTYYMASVSLYGDCIVALSNCTQFHGKGAVYNPQYLLSIPWIVVDFISCFILLAAAFFAYWLRTRTLAPDIFGYVSSLTRENPHFNIPTENGSTLSGMERARLLANVKLKIGGYSAQGLPRVVVSHVANGYEAEALKKEGKYA